MPGTADLIAAYEDLVAARPDYELADDMYAGDVGELYASARVRRLLAKMRADEVEEFNYAHIPVDTIANRLEITAVSVVRDDIDGTTGQGKEEDGDGVRTEAAAAKAPAAAKGGQGDGKAAATPDARQQRLDAAQAALDKLRADNQLDAEEPGLHLKASKNGDAYVIVWPRGDTAGDVTTVDIRVNTAATMRVIYDQEDPLTVAYAIKSWTYDEEVDGKKMLMTRATLYYDNRVERWISKPGKKGKALCDPANWEPYEPPIPDSDGREPAIIEHQYGRVPVFHFRNDRPYGIPEHRYAYGPQQMLNKLVAAQAVAIDFQSFPQRYALMDPTADQPMGNLLDPNHPEDDDDPEGDGNVSQLSADPSALWRLFGVKTTGQYDPASPDTFLKPFDRFVQAMAELTETPLYRFGSAFAQTPSGAALRAADTATINKTEARHRSYGPQWQDVYEFGLKLLGFDDVRVQVEWKPAAQVTDFEAWSVVGQKVDAGVPRRQALIETGYSAEQVDDWADDPEAQDQSMIRQVELLNAVAGAVQNLGSAVALGVLDEGHANELIARLLGKPGDDTPPAPPAPPPGE